MKRRDFLKYLGAAGIACCVPKSGNKLFANSSAAVKPNIILIHVDDMGWADVNYNAPHDWYESPRIDALKNAGMEFTDGYAACAVCSPTRASLMTGRYTPRTGVTDWIAQDLATNPTGYEGGSSQEYLTPKNYSFLEPSEITIPEVLKTAGYTTCHVGKWHLGGNGGTYYPDQQGFDYNIAGCDWGCPKQGFFDPYQIPTLTDRNNGEYLTDRENEEAIEFIQTSVGSSTPFFLYMAHYAVHTPIQGRADYVSYFNSKPKPSGWEHLNETFAAMIKSVDDAVGALVDELDSLGVTNNTLIIFTSDNGGHQPVSDNTPLREGKRWPYEGGIREPWFFVWPGKIAAGTSSDYPICSIDVMPTLCDIVGERLPSGVAIDGISLLPLLKQNSSLKQRDMFWHYPHYIIGNPPYTIIRSGKWKLIRWYDSNKTAELYDLESDISETTDLASACPDKVKHLQEKIDTWLVSVDAKVPLKNPGYSGAQPEKKTVKIG